MENQTTEVENEDTTETKNLLKTFCKETTLHGWSYLSKDISKSGRFIWSVFMLIIFSVSIFFIYINVDQVCLRRV